LNIFSRKVIKTICKESVIKYNLHTARKTQRIRYGTMRYDELNCQLNLIHIQRKKATGSEAWKRDLN